MSDSVVIDCPMPPSLNGIWRAARSKNGGKPGFYLSKRYDAWRKHFDSIIMATRPRPKMPGHFHATITLDQTKRAGDADNRCKVALDALQRCAIIENDKFADSVTVRWGHAPEGCRIMLTPSPSRAVGAAA